MTGYLTQRGYIGNGYYRLAVPNREICNIIIERVLPCFARRLPKTASCLKPFAMQSYRQMKRLLNSY